MTGYLSKIIVIDKMTLIEHPHLQVAWVTRQTHLSSRVQLLVIVESPIVSEPATAYRTNVCIRFLVHVHVGPQVLVFTKTLATLVTLVRAQLQMICDYVAFQSV